MANSIQGTRITKCVEGLHNKAFILKMDNGSEVFAKLPNPNAGPAHFSVASEVATRELVRYSVSFSRYRVTKTDSFGMYSIFLFQLWSGPRRDMNLDRGPCKYVNYRIPILLYLIFLLACAGKNALKYTRAIGTMKGCGSRHMLVPE